MATLTQRINELATAIRNKFNQIMPRLLPPGGTVGQALVKASDADNSFEWASVEGGGTTGPITNDQLPDAIMATNVANPSRVQVNGKGIVTALLPGTGKGSNRGAWTVLNSIKRITFEDDSWTADVAYLGQAITSGDNLVLFPKLAGNYEVGGLTLSCIARAGDEFAINYDLTGPAGSAVAILVDGDLVEFDGSPTDGQKTLRVTLAAGAHTILVTIQNPNPAEASDLLVSWIDVPVETYVFGDVVTHNGKSWQCLVAGTTETPGSGNGWTPILTDILPSNNLWNGSNTFAGSVALNGTSTAVTAAAGTNSTAIATTEFVASATAALTPRLVPFGGTAGQVLTRDSTGNATWADATGGSGSTDTTGPSPLTFYNLGLV